MEKKVGRLVACKKSPPPHPPGVVFLEINMPGNDVTLVFGGARRQVAARLPLFDAEDPEILQGENERVPEEA